MLDIRPHHVQSPYLAQARTWLAQCRREHRNCKKPPESSFLPTRLIKVEWNEENQSLSAQLCASSALLPGKDYCTLSHVGVSKTLLHWAAITSRSSSRTSL